MRLQAEATVLPDPVSGVGGSSSSSTSAPAGTAKTVGAAGSGSQAGPANPWANTKVSGSREAPSHRRPHADTGSNGRGGAYGPQAQHRRQSGGGGYHDSSKGGGKGRGNHGADDTFSAAQRGKGVTQGVAPAAVLAQGRSQDAGASTSRKSDVKDSTSVGSSVSVAGIMEQIDREVARMSPKKDLLLKAVQEAVASSSALEGCRVEVVGSTSWGGAVPQSDLDLVMFSSTEDVQGRDAVALLAELRAGLEARPQAATPWKQIVLVDAARVPILRLIGEQCVSCDVSVDQHRALGHREVLKKALAGRPEILQLVKLVKFWLRRRGLPMAAEGGLPSLAWAVSALALAEEQPKGASVECLLLHFFSQMRRLAEYALHIEYTEQFGTRFSWKRRHAHNAWVPEWVQLLLVDDPGNLGKASTASPSGRPAKTAPLGITAPSIPSALAVLYLAEIRLAWKAISQGLWDELWRPTTQEVCMPLPALLDLRGRKAPLHIILKDGEVHLGQLVKVLPCPTMKSAEVLHRRDQSSELILDPVQLIKEGKDGNNMTVSKICNDGSKNMTCQPCHWICALPTWNVKVLQGDALDRLTEVKLIIGPHMKTIRQIMPAMPVIPLCHVPPPPSQPPCVKFDVGVSTPAPAPVVDALVKTPRQEEEVWRDKKPDCEIKIVTKNAVNRNWVATADSGAATPSAPVAVASSMTASSASSGQQRSSLMYAMVPASMMANVRMAGNVMVPQGSFAMFQAAWGMQCGMHLSSTPQGYLSTVAAPQGMPTLIGIPPVTGQTPLRRSPKCSHVQGEVCRLCERPSDRQASSTPSAASASNPADAKRGKKNAEKNSDASEQTRRGAAKKAAARPALTESQPIEADSARGVDGPEPCLLPQRAHSDDSTRASDSDDDPHRSGGADSGGSASSSGSGSAASSGAASGARQRTPLQLQPMQPGRVFHEWTEEQLESRAGAASSFSADAICEGGDSGGGIHAAQAGAAVETEEEVQTSAASVDPPPASASAQPTTAILADADDRACHDKDEIGARVETADDAPPLDVGSADSEDVVEGLLARIDGVVSELERKRPEDRCATVQPHRGRSASAADWAAICGNLEAKSAELASKTVANSQPSSAELASDVTSSQPPIGDPAHESTIEPTIGASCHGEVAKVAAAASAPSVSVVERPPDTQPATVLDEFSRRMSRMSKMEKALRAQIEVQAQTMSAWGTVLALNLDAPRWCTKQESSRLDHKAPEVKSETEAEVSVQAFVAPTIAHLDAARLGGR